MPRKRNPRQRRCRFEVLERRLLLANDLAAVEVNVEEAILDVLANDAFLPGNLPTIESLTAPPAHGNAEVVFEGTRIRYTPDADFSGVDLLSYRATDTLGNVVTGEVQIEVGRLAVEAATLQQWEAASANVNEAWLGQLEDPSVESLAVPGEGVLIERPVVITTAKMIQGDTNLIRFRGAGRLIIELANPDDAVAIENAELIWQPGSDPEPAVEVRSGQLSLNANSIAAISNPDDSDSETPTWFIDVSQDGAIGEVRANTFHNAYWRTTSLLRVDGAGQDDLTFADNEVYFFDEVLDLKRLRSVDIANNKLHRNTGGNVRLQSTTDAFVAGNRVELPGGFGIDATDWSELQIVDNLISNADDVGISLGGSGDNAHLVDNFVHASRNEAIRVAGQAGQAIKLVTLEDNILAQNGGFGVQASEIDRFVALGNLLHQNGSDAESNQHALESIGEIEDRDNLQDQDNTSEDFFNRKTFGSNAQHYSFTAQNNSPVPSSSPLAIDLAVVETLRPAATAEQSESFLSDLELGGQFTVPEAGVVVDRVVTLQHPTEIVGGGVIEIVAGGKIIVDMADAFDPFVVRDTTLMWSLDLGEPGSAVDAVQLKSGKVTLEENAIYSVVKPSEAHYADTEQLFFRSAPSNFFRIGQADSVLPEFRMVGNEIVNAYWYSTQLLKTSAGMTMPGADVSNNEIRYFHGAIYLEGLNDADVSDNRLFRNSFASVAVDGSQIRISRNRLLFSGNGTTGDGITVGTSEDVLISNNLVTNGTCYGVWLLNGAHRVVVEGNIFHAGITSAVNFDPATVNVLGLELQDAVANYSDIVISGNLFSHNAGLGARLAETRNLTFDLNTLQSNNSGGDQHLFLGVVDVKERGNVQAFDRIPAEAAAPIEYRLTTPHFVVRGSELSVYGSASSENFLIEPDYNGLLRVQWGDYRASYAPDTIDRVRVISEGGADFTRLYASSLPTQVNLQAPEITAIDDRFQISIVNMASAEVRSDGNDQATLVDPGDAATLYLRDGYVRLRTPSGDYRAVGFSATRTELEADGADRVDAYWATPANLALQLSEGEQRFQVGYETHQVTTGAKAPIVIDAGGEDDRIEILATPGDDVADLSPSGGRIVGDDYDVVLRNLETIVLDGNGGLDIATLNDSVADDQFWARPAYAYLQGDGFLNEVRGFSHVQANSHDGQDTAHWYGSAAADSFVADPSMASLVGPEYEFDAVGFQRVIAKGGGGYDRAHLFDSASDDLFVGRESYSYLQGPGYLNQVDSFEHVIGESSGGEDYARLFDSSGDDLFIGRQSYSFMQGEGYLNEVRRFPKVRADARAGNDEARLFDSSGDDLFVGRPGYSYLVSDAQENLANGFDIVEGVASAGNDSAIFSDSAGADRYVARAGYAYLQGLDSAYLNQATGFDSTTATGYLGGEDVAWLFDSPSDDRFVARANNAYMLGPEVVHEAIAFPSVTARSVNGGADRAEFYASPNEDLFVARPTLAYLTGAGFTNQANLFPVIDVFGGQANDRAKLYGSPGDDRFTGDPNVVQLTGSSDFMYRARGFGRVDAYGMGAVTRDSAELLGAVDGNQFVSRQHYDYLQAGSALLLVHQFGTVRASAPAADDWARLYEIESDDTLSLLANAAVLERGDKVTTLTEFELVRAIADTSESPAAPEPPEDFVLELVGDWLD